MDLPPRANPEAKKEFGRRPTAPSGTSIYMAGSLVATYGRFWGGHWGPVLSWFADGHETRPLKEAKNSLASV